MIFRAVRFTISAMHKFHEPVMLKEVIEMGRPSAGEVWVDATAGFGGHSIEIARHLGDDGKVIAIEKDSETFRFLVDNTKKHNIIAVNDDYVNIKSILREIGISRVDGILFDLGLSSYHIDRSGRGFSYKKDEFLDMRFDPGTGEPLAELLPRLTEREIADIIYLFGEERRSRRIARAIHGAVRRSGIRTTTELNEAISGAVPRRLLGDVLPRVYQAFRIFVNRELEHVALGLARAAEALAIGGRLVIISYHSLEDRIAKGLGRLEAFERLNKKVLRPSEEEVRRNPRSRSARLRALLKKGEIDEESAYNYLVAFVPRLHRGH